MTTDQNPNTGPDDTEGHMPFRRRTVSDSGQGHNDTPADDTTDDVEGHMPLRRGRASEGMKDMPADDGDDSDDAEGHGIRPRI